MASGEFVVSKTGRLAAEKEIVTSLVLRLKNVERVWTVSSLKNAAADYGVSWTDDQVKELVEALYKEAIIEDVPEIVPEPEPEPEPIPVEPIVTPEL